MSYKSQVAAVFGALEEQIHLYIDPYVARKSANDSRNKLNARILYYMMIYCVTNLHWVKESNRRGGPNCNSLRGKEYVAFIVLFVLSSDAPRKRSGERYFIHL